MSRALFALMGFFAFVACAPSTSRMTDELTQQDSLDLLLSAILDSPISNEQRRVLAVCLEPTTENLGGSFPDRGIPAFPEFSDNLLENLRAALEEEIGFPVETGCREDEHPFRSFSEDSNGDRILLVRISMPTRVGRDTVWVASGRQSLGAGLASGSYFIVGKWVRTEGVWSRVDAVAIS